MPRTACANCHAPLTLRNARVGRLVRCSRCGATNRLKKRKESSYRWQPISPPLVASASSRRYREAAAAVSERTPRTRAETAILSTARIDDEEARGSRMAQSEQPRRRKRASSRGHRTSSSLGPYEILDELGRGGMGMILKARDRALNRDVAVKVMRPETRKHADRRLRFVEEAQITGQLEHPGIAPVHFLGRDDDGLEFFSMKLVAGMTLEELLEKWHDRSGRIREEYPQSRLLSIFERVAETVGFAHARGILHRDLKPANVMVGKYGEVWVLDWGLAKVIGEDKEVKSPKEEAEQAVSWVRENVEKALTLDGHTVGTPEYMAPEQARAEQLDRRADIFSLGAILYHILTGDPPYKGKSAEDVLSSAALARFKPLRATRAGRRVPRALAAIVRKCMARRTRDRFAATEELLRDLRAYAEGEPVSALPDSFRDRMGRFARKHWRGLAAAGATVLLFLMVITTSAIVVAGKDREALRARDQEAKAKREAAEAIAENAAKAQRRMKAFEPYAKAIDLLMRGQKPEESVRLLGEALKIDPEFPEAQFALGEALRREGRPQKAAEAYSAAHQLSTRLAKRPNARALLAAGFAYDGAGQYEKAEASFLKAEKIGPDDPLALIGKAFRLSYYQRLKEARKATERAVKLAPHLWEAQFGVGHILYDSAKAGVIEPKAGTRKAIAAFRRAHELSPDQAEVCVWLAQALSKKAPDERREAQALMKRAIKLEPLNGNRYFNRAMWRMGAGDKAGARQDMAKAREMGLSTTHLQIFNAFVLQGEGKREQAFRAMGKALKGSNHFPSHLANWFLSAINVGKLGTIRPQFDRWCVENPTFHYTHYAKGFLAYQNKDLKGAVECWEKGLELAPYNRQLIRAMMGLHTATGDWKKALELVEKAEGIAPDDVAAKATRLMCLIGMKRFQEAGKLLKALEKKHPANADMWNKYRKHLQQSRKAK